MCDRIQPNPLRSPCHQATAITPHPGARQYHTRLADPPAEPCRSRRARTGGRATLSTPPAPRGAHDAASAVADDGPANSTAHHETRSRPSGIRRHVQYHPRSGQRFPGAKDRPNVRRVDPSSGETGAPLGPTTSEDDPSGAGSHASTEAVSLLAATSVGLKGLLHRGSVSRSKANPQYTDGPLRPSLAGPAGPWG